MSKCIAYDFETLGTGQSVEARAKKQQRPAVVNVAFIEYDDTRFTSDPYEYDDLLEKVVFIKFDVADQVKNYGRTIERDTLQWWNTLPPEAKKQIKVMPNDVSIREINNILSKHFDIDKVKKIYSRGRFDHNFLESLCIDIGEPNPFPFWVEKDIRSFIEGLSFGTTLKNDFIPSEELKKKFIKHNPVHDVAMDIMRMQTLIRELF
jgi:hypothetical protein